MDFRITEISVKGLFGMFDHVIPLNQKERITVIYGENGIGKTMIFRILDALAKQNWEVLEKLPFHEFIISFSGQKNDSLIILKEDELKLRISEGGNEKLVFDISSVSKSRNEIMKDLENQTLSELGIILKSFKGIQIVP